MNTPDGDEVVLDSLPGDPRRPQLLLVHGLEGSSCSPYAQRLLRGARQAGIAATVMHFRSCALRAGDRSQWIPNRRPRLYHGGDTGDLDLVVRTLRRRAPEQPLLALGVSLGGNVLLKWLGEQGRDAPLAAAVSISAPFDLAASDQNMSAGMNRLYVQALLPTLQAKLLYLAERFPEVRARCDVVRARRARTWIEFDDAATGPLHGFASGSDYYRRSSSVQFVDRIAVPTLCINAADDPFSPGTVFPRVREAAAPSVELAFTRRGGHVGFVAGRTPLSVRHWSEELAIRWLLERTSMTVEA